ncbi:hypothetical protein SK128_008018, partial [Halocaridina rubra]
DVTHVEWQSSLPRAATPTQAVPDYPTTLTDLSVSVSSQDTSVSPATHSLPVHPSATPISTDMPIAAPSFLQASQCHKAHHSAS